MEGGTSRDFPHGSTSSSDESTAARSSSRQGASCSSPASDESKSDSSSAQRKPPSKSISSFTVENILMGRQRSFSSSDSPTTTTAANFLTLPPSSATSSISTMSNHSSVVGTNWVSHPPVKYTKFTMLSPTSMADETQRRKKTDNVLELQWREQGSRESGQTHTSSNDQGHDLKRIPSSLRGSMVDLSNSFSVSQKPKSFSRSSSSGTPSSFFHKASDPQPQSFPTHNVFQSAAKLSTLPLLQTVPAAATDVKTGVLHQTFPASGQQVVLLIPSNSTSIAAASLPTVFYTNPVLSLGQSSLSPSPAVSGTAKLASGSPTTHTHTHTHTHSNSSSTSSSSLYHEERLSSHQRHSVIDETSPSAHDQSEAYRPIAPKTAAASTTTAAESAHRDHRESKNSNDRMKLYLKRTIPKPPKLRFHMTTVMKQPTGNTVMTSLTAQSPQAMSSETSAGVDCGPLSAAAVSVSDGEQLLRPEVAAESKITRSPNVYSCENSSQKQQGVYQVKQEPDSSGSSPSSTLSSPNHNTLNSAPTSGSFSHATGKNGSVSKAQTTVLKDSGFHLQLVKQQGGGGAGDTNGQSVKQHSSDQEASPGDLHLQQGPRQNGRQQSGPGRGRGRTTRSYTRRKRELTFHLYEDPSTAFRAKRQCRDNNKEPQQ